MKYEPYHVYKNTQPPFYERPLIGTLESTEDATPQIVDGLKAHGYLNPLVMSDEDAMGYLLGIADGSISPYGSWSAVFSYPHADQITILAFKDERDAVVAILHAGK